jgi:hypothetical protein
MIRMLIVGYVFALGSERRLCALRRVFEGILVSDMPGSAQQ